MLLTILDITVNIHLLTFNQEQLNNISLESRSSYYFWSLDFVTLYVVISVTIKILLIFTVLFYMCGVCL